MMENDLLVTEKFPVVDIYNILLNEMKQRKTNHIAVVITIKW